MELSPRAGEKISRLLAKGVNIPNPLTLDIGDEVDPDLISGDGVKIYPGCRIYGEKTVLSKGVCLGKEAPVTIDNCQLGAEVELKGGYFRKSVFLTKANMGSGAQVREACLLEEEANGAHCVGLKQTILFPFVTLGSLINFCDCFMAGGTSRKDHSEVGSSYIHFNFTPDGDKATASLFGDVPRGVMLKQPRIVLGGQGGAVGPLICGYGNVVAAGSILRRSHPNENQLIFGKTHGELSIDYVPSMYPNFDRLVENNLLFLGNLSALEQWYIHVRQLFFADMEFGRRLYDGALGVLAAAKSERSKRLRVLAEKAYQSARSRAMPELAVAGRRDLFEHLDELTALFADDNCARYGQHIRDRFVEHLLAIRQTSPTEYIEFIQSLPPDIAALGAEWLAEIVNTLNQKAMELLPSIELFIKSLDDLT
ncbi:MAG TPA: UDP-N-acetylglucosamine pyrophosphorylase [bacterium]|nr:UDP-N-acetylglucosamine pyrophosphorylase [bacterium]